jgi:hypothetical protein
MNTVTGFVAVISLLLALAAAGGTTEPQAGITIRKSGEGQKEAGLVSPSKLATNHNETLVRDTSAQQADTLSRLMTSVQSFVFGNFSFRASGSGCAPFICGTDGNHNETLVRDTPPVQ